MRIRFGSFTLDADTRELLAGTQSVRVTPKAFDLLQILLRERPKVLTKAELLARIWPGTHVVEANLNGLIGELRRALGDSTREPRFIRTVHGTGFAFAADAFDGPPPSASTASAPREWRCWLVSADQRFVLTEGPNVIGRDPRSDIWLDASRVSRQHARVVVDGSIRRALIEDAGSTNGTFVGRVQIASAVALSDGDVIDIGSVELTFRAWAGEKLAETERIRRQPPESRG